MLRHRAMRRVALRTCEALVPYKPVPRSGHAGLAGHLTIVAPVPFGSTLRYTSDTRPSWVSSLLVEAEAATTGIDTGNHGNQLIRRTARKPEPSALTMFREPEKLRWWGRPEFPRRTTAPSLIVADVRPRTALDPPGTQLLSHQERSSKIYTFPKQLVSFEVTAHKTYRKGRGRIRLMAAKPLSDDQMKLPAGEISCLQGMARGPIPNRFIIKQEIKMKDLVRRLVTSAVYVILREAETGEVIDVQRLEISPTCDHGKRQGAITNTG